MSCTYEFVWIYFDSQLDQPKIKLSTMDCHILNRKSNIIIIFLNYEIYSILFSVLAVSCNILI